jgi:hypothetical protein
MRCEEGKNGRSKERKKRKKEEKKNIYTYINKNILRTKTPSVRFP